MRTHCATVRERLETTLLGASAPSGLEHALGGCLTDGARELGACVGRGLLEVFGVLGLDAGPQGCHPTAPSSAC
jgi:hypothetical protein